jgi:hypothetical protein
VNITPPPPPSFPLAGENAQWQIVNLIDELARPIYLYRMHLPFYYERETSHQIVNEALEEIRAKISEHVHLSEGI